MKSITISAPGKLHLLGEHAVVYGKPAIIAAINKRSKVTLTPTKESAIDIVSIDLDKHMLITPEIILERTQQARKAWEKFNSSKDISELKELIKDPLNFLVFVIGETFLYFDKKPSSGFTLQVSCDIPMGSGMGSSASMSVAIAGAVSRFLGFQLDKKAINEIAFNCEKLVHGNPSGGDNAACTYGGLIWYRKETQDVKIVEPLPFGFPKNLADKFVTIFTGKPDETTGELVAHVREQYNIHRHKIKEILDSQEELTRGLVAALQTQDIEGIKQIIKAGEANLEAMGVVSDSTKQIIRDIEVASGAAKICGAGGRAGASGIVLAFHEDGKALQDLLKYHNLSYSPVNLGEEGIREE
jgi:mevalonate kinase